MPLLKRSVRSSPQADQAVERRYPNGRPALAWTRVVRWRPPARGGPGGGARRSLRGLPVALAVSRGRFPFGAIERTTKDLSQLNVRVYDYYDYNSHMQWQIKDAKSHFSELVDKAVSEGPQHIAKRGKVQAVILSIEEFDRLRALQPSFRDYLLSGPKVDEFEAPRDSGVDRHVDL